MSEDRNRPLSFSERHRAWLNGVSTGVLWMLFSLSVIHELWLFAVVDAVLFVLFVWVEVRR